MAKREVPNGTIEVQASGNRRRLFIDPSELPMWLEQGWKVVQSEQEEVSEEAAEQPAEVSEEQEPGVEEKTGRGRRKAG